MMRYFKPARRLAGAMLLTLLVPLAGCDLAPPYKAPDMVLPASYKGTGPFGLANPEAQLAQGDWWKMFGDEKLNGLEASLNAANPDLQAAEETYTHAHDVARLGISLFSRLKRLIPRRATSWAWPARSCIRS